MEKSNPFLTFVNFIYNPLLSGFTFMIFIVTVFISECSVGDYLFQCALMLKKNTPVFWSVFFQSVLAFI